MLTVDDWLGRWDLWWAWWPVRLENGRWAWWRMIERREKTGSRTNLAGRGATFDGYAYRDPAREPASIAGPIGTTEDREAALWSLAEHLFDAEEHLDPTGREWGGLTPREREFWYFAVSNVLLHGGDVCRVLGINFPDDDVVGRDAAKRPENP